MAGDSGVGKTSFVHRFTTNYFHKDYKGTVGVDFATKIRTLPDGRKVKLQLCDIAGQERFTWMMRVYCRESQGCIIMMDLARKKFFYELYKMFFYVHLNANRLDLLFPYELSTDSASPCGGWLFIIKQLLMTERSTPCFERL